MAKKKKLKTKPAAKGYIEKIIAQIFNKYHKEITSLIKKHIKNTKKMMPILKKRFKNKLKKELKTSFRMTPSSKTKKRKK
jgi:hypothetical protein